MSKCCVEGRSATVCRPGCFPCPIPSRVWILTSRTYCSLHTEIISCTVVAHPLINQSHSLSVRTFYEQAVTTVKLIQMLQYTQHLSLPSVIIHRCTTPRKTLTVTPSVHVSRTARMSTTQSTVGCGNTLPHTFVSESTCTKQSQFALHVRRDARRLP